MSSEHKMSQEEVFDYYYDDIVFDMFQKINENCWRDVLLQKLKYNDFREFILDNVYIPPSPFDSYDRAEEKEALVIFWFVLICFILIC